MSESQIVQMCPDCDCKMAVRVVYEGAVFECASCHRRWVVMGPKMNDCMLVEVTEVSGEEVAQMQLEAFEDGLTTRITPDGSGGWIFTPEEIG